RATPVGRPAGGVFFSDPRSRRISRHLLARGGGVRCHPARWDREGMNMSHPSAHGPAGTKPGASPGAPQDYRGAPAHQEYDRSSAENPEFWYDPAMGLQKLERLRFPYFQEHLGPFAGKRALDVGCGGGILAEDLARAGARVVGVDASQVTVEAARAHAARQ